MSRALARLFFAVLLGCLVAAGPLSTSIGPAGEWVAAAVPATRDGPAHTSILQRGAGGRLIERATTARGVAQLATLGSRLAFLCDDGTWSLVSEGGLAPGLPLPDVTPPDAIAAAGDALLFAAGERLYRFDGRSFADAGTAPARPATAAGVQLLASRDALLLGWIDGAALHLSIRSGGDWRAIEPVAAARFWLVDDERAGPSVVIHAIDGGWSRRAVRPDATLGEPTPLDIGPLDARADVAVSGLSGELRITTDDGKQLSERTIDASGKAIGSTRALSTILPTSGGTLFDRLMSVASLIAIAVVIFAGGRSDVGGDSAERPEPARLGVRAVAGLVDAWPLFVAVGVAVLGTPIELYQETGVATPRVQWSLAAGVAGYIVIAGLSELLSGRTLGKWLFGLRVVSVDGAPPAARAIVLRNVLRLLDLNLVLLLIVPLSALRQRLADLVARTMVVESPPKSPPPAADKDS